MSASVRSTNVYEEQSLGVFHHDDPDPDDQVEGFEASGSRMTVWSRYLTLHARRQLSFGQKSPPQMYCDTLTLNSRRHVVDLPRIVFALHH